LSAPDIEILGLGVVVPDVKRDEETDPCDPYRGKLRSVDVQPNVSEDELRQCALGGLGNWAPVLATLGFRTGVMGYVGDDVAGRIYGQRLEEEFGVSNLLIRTRYPTAVSFVKVSPDSGERTIEFYPGANQYFDFEPDVLSKIRENGPRIVHIAYAGLCKLGFDRNCGENLASGVAQMRSMGMFTSVDTHTIEDYSILDSVLAEVDLFVCNHEEASAICGKKSDVREVGQLLGRKYLNLRNGLRIFGVTTSKGAYYMFQDKRGETEGGFIGSRYGEIPAVDKTGAGDSHKAGLHAYLLANWEKVQAGELDEIDIAHAFQVANLTATLNIQGEGVSGFRGAEYADLDRVVSGVRRYTTAADLYAALGGLAKQSF